MNSSLLFVIIAVLFLLILCYKIWARSLLIGKWGEMRVKVILGFLPKEYVVFNDVTITSRGHSSQIDHIVVSVYGIFVIETKSHKGWIYGGENAQYWTQNIWGHKYQLYNPLLQNESHIRALQRVIHLANAPYIPIVVFTNASRVSVQTDYTIISHWSLYHTIRQHKEHAIDESSIDTICENIKAALANEEDVDKNHRRYVESQTMRNRESISKGRCPRCGGKIVLRHGSYGSFYGCSNYPKCKFTMNE